MLSNVSCIYELEFTWLRFVQTILNECGMPYTFIHSNWIVNVVKLSLKDQLEESCHTSIQNSPQLLFTDIQKKHSKFRITNTYSNFSSFELPTINFLLKQNQKKDKKHNGQNKKDKGTSNVLQNIDIKLSSNTKPTKYRR